MSTISNAGMIRMDRRHFVRLAGLLAAGSAIGSSLPGCSSFEFAIPDLGPSPPPTPVPGMTYIRASELGCALDCDLGSGRNKYTGGTRDATMMVRESTLPWRQPTRKIRLRDDHRRRRNGFRAFPARGGNWGIAGLGYGTGFFVKAGTHNDGAILPCRCQHPLPQSRAPSSCARDVSLSNFTLNGNQGGDSTTGIRQGTNSTWYCGINLMNLDNIAVEKVVVVNTPAFHFRFANVGHVKVDGCVMKSFG